MATVGNIVFSFIMMSVSLILIVESIRDIASHGGNEGDGLTDFHVPAIVAVSIAFFVKLGRSVSLCSLPSYPPLTSFSRVQRVVCFGTDLVGPYIMGRPSK